MNETPHDEFYEDDQPIEEVLDAFERGCKVVIGPPGIEIPDAPRVAFKDCIFTDAKGTP